MRLSDDAQDVKVGVDVEHKELFASWGDDVNGMQR